MGTTARTTSFVDLVFLHARIRPEKPAIVLADRVVTYDMMAQGILRMEDRLRTSGLAPGDLVGIAIESPVRHMIVAAALFRLGHPSLSVRHIADVLPLNLPIGVFLHAANEKIHIGQRQIFVGDDWFAGERKPVPAARSVEFTDDQAICRVELSSGTTGRRKAVSLSVDAVHKWLINYSAAIGVGGWERLLCLPGLTSSWGFTVAAHALFAGKTLAFAQTARDSLDLISVYGIDAMVASTQQLSELVREQIKAPVPCSSLRVVLTGGSLLPRSLMLDAGARLSAQSSTNTDLPKPAQPRWRQSIGSWRSTEPRAISRPGPKSKSLTRTRTGWRPAPRASCGSVELSGGAVSARPRRWARRFPERLVLSR